jgi:hypothetical protein
MILRLERGEVAETRASMFAGGDEESMMQFVRTVVEEGALLVGMDADVPPWVWVERFAEALESWGVAVPGIWRQLAEARRDDGAHARLLECWHERPDDVEVGWTGKMVAREGQRSS